MADGMSDELPKSAAADQSPPALKMDPGSAEQNAASASRPPLSSEDSPPPDISIAEVKTSFWLTRGDRMLLGVLVVVMLTLMGWHWAKLSGWGAEPVEISRLEKQRLNYKIDVNSATWVEWVQLDGIGDTLAARIVADRKENGPFKSLDDLKRVKGIGPKTVERLRPHLTLGKRED
ncbi:MAG: helix-hairpin-helix domain-containing protein [Planctomycetes bacterium]|nr:helix-hairpin-helix domain-containing protein [Planctomycetota bacterium]